MTWRGPGWIGMLIHLWGFATSSGLVIIYEPLAWLPTAFDSKDPRATAVHLLTYYATASITVSSYLPSATSNIRSLKSAVLNGDFILIDLLRCWWAKWPYGSIQISILHLCPLIYLLSPRLTTLSFTARSFFSICYFWFALFDLLDYRLL